ncbi:MAG: hypothetical protein NZL87_06100 [Thermomicrobium sp.]|nr:hypothetical protein [Thermomicrobium sp.]MDW8060929.1 hypothetical protein [Thermomicrobium sp.]
MSSTALLYQEDSHVRAFDARVVGVTPDHGVVLDRTAFYPGGSGQPHDTGVSIAQDGAGGR